MTEREMKPQSSIAAATTKSRSVWTPLVHCIPVLAPAGAREEQFGDIALLCQCGGGSAARGFAASLGHFFFFFFAAFFFLRRGPI